MRPSYSAKENVHENIHENFHKNVHENVHESYNQLLYIKIVKLKTDITQSCYKLSVVNIFFQHLSFT